MHSELPLTEGAANLARSERRTWAVVVASSLGTFAALALLAAVPQVPEDLSAALVGLLAVVAVLFTIVAYRTGVARRGLRKGCREVLAVGWTRAPDGCNYAVFTRDVDPAGAEPELVIRLPTRRQTRSSVAFLCGSTKPSRWGATALLAPDGELLALGRVRSRASGQKVWRRRHAPTPWWSAGENLASPPDL